MNFRLLISTITIMQNYMLTVLVKNNLDEKERGALIGDIKKQFGSLKKEDLWGARSLAYPISKQDKAYFAHFEFESEPNTISSLDKMVKLNEDVIRYLLTKVELPKKVAKPKKQVVKKEESEEIVDKELVEDKE